MKTGREINLILPKFEVANMLKLKTNKHSESLTLHCQ